MRFTVATLAGCTALLWASAAHAMDKQGSAHGGQVEGESTGFNVSGAAMLGVAIANGTYGARPDNTGLTLMRYAAHADFDLIGRHLSIPLDINMFTDRTQPGVGRKLIPTELDIISGLTTTWSLGPGAIEAGARGEIDLPLYRPDGQSDFYQAYGDLRVRYLYSLGTIWPKLKRDLADGDISGFFTLGWFTINPSYAARPDNTGSALFRYGFHTELSVWHDYFSVGLDLTMFTDRRADNPVGPSELDLTYEAIVHFSPFEAHLAYERDMPIDRGGLVQSFIYALLVWNFDFAKKPEPIEARHPIVSP